MTLIDKASAQFDPGSLMHRVCLEVDDNAGGGPYDSYGGSTGNWQAVDGSSRVAAQITTLSGLELIRARQLVHEATHEVKCWYRKGVNTTQRWRWVDDESSTRYLYIRHKNNPDNAHVSLVLTCVEEPNA